MFLLMYCFQQLLHKLILDNQEENNVLMTTFQLCELSFWECIKTDWAFYGVVYLYGIICESNFAVDLIEMIKENHNELKEKYTSSQLTKSSWNLSVFQW